MKNNFPFPPTLLVKFVNMKTTLLLFFFVLNFMSAVNAQTKKDNDYLLEIFDSTTNAYGFINLKGDTVIPFNKYDMIFTDTFRSCAIVLKSSFGFMGIDRNENFLFNIFPFDNGPDYPSEDLFRIIDKGKIGYANLNGEIIIAPQFDCAYPFKNGKAKVSNNCISVSDDKWGEYHSWESNDWYFIDKKGKRIIAGK